MTPQMAAWRPNPSGRGFLTPYSTSRPRLILLEALRKKSNRYSATTPENIDVSSTLKGATSTNHVTDQKV